MPKPQLPITLTLATDMELEVMQIVLERGYEDLGEMFDDGSGETTPQQEICYELMRQVGLE